MSDIDVGQLSEAINDKADRDLGNTDPLARTVVEVSDENLMPSWYRVYSDGWCEQGGSNGTQATTTAHTVTLLKNYKNTDYTITSTKYQDNATSGGYNVGYSDKTTSNFILRGTSSSTSIENGFDWQASGYIE